MYSVNPSYLFIFVCMYNILIFMYKKIIIIILLNYIKKFGLDKFIFIIKIIKKIILTEIFFFNFYFYFSYLN